MRAQNSDPRPIGQFNQAEVEQLREFIRIEGPKYLDDPNVTSIGIGFEAVDGSPTGRVALQFTVAKKLTIQELQDSDSALLPSNVEVGELVFPTDVVEAEFAPSVRYESTFSTLTPQQVEDPERTRRHDPVIPGISVSNLDTSAGTLGAIVYDATNGTPYGLSNWHVLHGPDSEIGITTVQPGSYDDSNVARNTLGTLIRSHLGVAGDCAFTSVTERNFNATIFGLEITPDQIADPELGDKVVKSGRTTGVTDGIVSRVEVLTRIDFGGSVGYQNVNGFEISPTTADGIVSQGGDSGSVWLFKNNSGATTSIMAGLHFAGTVAGPNIGIACLPESVFGQLNVTLTPPA